MEHRLSCDLDSQCEKWVRSTQCPLMFVENILELADTVALDKITSTYKKIPQAEVCFCSWVCHDVHLGQTSKLVHAKPMSGFRLQVECCNLQGAGCSGRSCRLMTCTDFVFYMLLLATCILDLYWCDMVVRCRFQLEIPDCFQISSPSLPPGATETQSAKPMPCEPGVGKHQKPSMPSSSTSRSTSHHTSTVRWFLVCHCHCVLAAATFLLWFCLSKRFTDFQAMISQSPAITETHCIWLMAEGWAQIYHIQYSVYCDVSVPIEPNLAHPRTIAYSLLICQSILYLYYWLFYSSLICVWRNPFLTVALHSCFLSACCCVALLCFTRFFDVGR